MNSRSFPHTRREMLFGFAGAALASAQPRNRLYNPQLAAHTSIWSVEAQTRNLPLPEILEEAFTVTRRAGYKRVELVSEFLDPRFRKRTLALLEGHGLEPAILFAAGPLYDRDAAESSRRQILELAGSVAAHGATFVNFSLSARPQGLSKTTDDLDMESYQLNRMGEDLHRFGIDLMVHHDFTQMQDDARQWRYLLAHTETDLVCFCLDVDWVARAGISPVVLIDTAGPRLRSIHLRNPRNGVDQELLRDGDIDLGQIARLLRKMAYDGFLVVELLTHPQTERQYSLTNDLGLSRWYMQQVFGARPGSPPVDMGPHVRVRSS